MNRSQIFDALFALGSSLTWTPPGGSPGSFTYTSKRLQTWADCPEQPAFYQVKHDEKSTQKLGMPSKNILMYKWVIYFDTAKDQATVPIDQANAILDAIDGALTGTDNPDGRLTLGGLVNHVWTEGDTFCDDGALDGQGVIIVPINVMVP